MPRTVFPSLDKNNQIYYNTMVQQQPGNNNAVYPSLYPRHLQQQQGLYGQQQQQPMSLQQQQLALTSQAPSGPSSLLAAPQFNSGEASMKFLQN